MLLEDAQVAAMPAGVENTAGELKQEGERPPHPRDAHPGVWWVSPARPVPTVAFPPCPNPVRGCTERFGSGVSHIAGAGNPWGVQRGL